jgi:hypothetical protein
MYLLLSINKIQLELLNNNTIKTVKFVLNLSFYIIYFYCYIVYLIVLLIQYEYSEMQTNF